MHHDFINVLCTSVIRGDIQINIQHIINIYVLDYTSTKHLRISIILNILQQFYNIITREAIAPAKMAATEPEIELAAPFPPL